MKCFMQMSIWYEAYDTCKLTYLWFAEMLTANIISYYIFLYSLTFFRVLLASLTHPLSVPSHQPLQRSKQNACIPSGAVIHVRKQRFICTHKHTHSHTFEYLSILWTQHTYTNQGWDGGTFVRAVHGGTLQVRVCVSLPSH